MIECQTGKATGSNLQPKQLESFWSKYGLASSLDLATYMCVPVCVWWFGII